MSPTLRVCFVTTGLTTGGAEMMLLKLATDPPFEPMVISLGTLGTVGPRIRALGVPVQALGLGARRIPTALSELRSLIAKFDPHVVQGWMYHGNLAATYARGSGATRAPVAWSIRQSLGTLRNEKPMTAAVILAGVPLSHRSPRVITYNSSLSARQHERLGYAPARTRVVPNGFDVSRFRPDPALRAAGRAALGVDSDTLVVGMSARFHPMKDHPNLLAAAARLVGEGRRIRFVVAGAGTDGEAFSQLVSRANLRGHVAILGERQDMQAILPAWDVACLASSWGEGFPNAIGEAMACEVPPVVTDVGDSARLVGDAGTVVPPNDSAALAAAIAALHDAGPEARAAIGRRARARIAGEFSLARASTAYLDVYRQMLDTPAGSPA